MAFFSGGKDGLYATYLAENQGIDVPYLLLFKTTIGLSPHYENIDSLKKIARSMKKELFVFDMKNGSKELAKFIKSFGVSHIIGGDIYLEAHFEWINHLARESNTIALEPLWKKDSFQLTKEMIVRGFVYSIIAVDKGKLSKDWLGYTFINSDDLQNFAYKTGVDPAGEGGEFHTVVLESPLFDSSFEIKGTDFGESDRYFYLKFNLKEVKK